jgi:cell division protein FtsB
MSLKQNILQFIKGEALLNEAAFKHWKMILFVIALLLYMIRAAHRTDELVMKIAKLKKQENELRAEYIALRSKTMRLKMETTVMEAVKDHGLHPAEKPAKIIREELVKQKDE